MLPATVQTLSSSDGQELRSQHPCAFLLKQEVRVGERDQWTTERKKKKTEMINLNSTLEIVHF